MAWCETPESALGGVLLGDAGLDGSFDRELCLCGTFDVFLLVGDGTTTTPPSPFYPISA